MKPNPESADSIIPADGERMLLIGPTGGGKTALACWILRRFPVSPLVIMDTKDEDKFLALPKLQLVGDWESLRESLDNESFDYVVFRPADDEVNEPEVMDAYLESHYEDNRGIPIYLDETYSFEKNGRTGPGLGKLLTRGRSRGITTIMATQRPAHISRFCFTESQLFAVLPLVHRDDEKRVGQFIPGFDGLPRPDKYSFYSYRVGESAPVLHPAIVLDSGIDRGYTDSRHSENSADAPATDHLDWL